MYQDPLLEMLKYQLEIQNNLRMFMGGIPWQRFLMITEKRKVIYFEISLN
jgi:hypothetical protein